jgi:deoxyribonuclease (pyrimidine dimer)
MTRINVIPVTELLDKRLLAEYRELPRIFALSRKWYERGGDPADLPKTYRLGAGHVRFFYDKLIYCYLRQHMLVNECQKRMFSPKYWPNRRLIAWAPEFLKKDYLPTQEAMALNRERIAERLREM